MRMLLFLQLLWTRLSWPVLAYLTHARSRGNRRGSTETTATRSTITTAKNSIITALSAATATTGGDLTSARRFVAEGMTAFRNGQVERSIDWFDQAERAAPALITPYLWQRGLSYYYTDQFDNASRQFRTDVQVNPADVEEIVWDIASQLRRSGDNGQFPVPSQLQLPRNDPRRIMVRPVVAGVAAAAGTSYTALAFLSRSVIHLFPFLSSRVCIACFEAKERNMI
jgi:tetratricopeptide (TPR) repeat protein